MELYYKLISTITGHYNLLYPYTKKTQMNQINQRRKDERN